MSAPFDPTSTTGRRLRAGLFAVLVVQLSALGHLAGGGNVPGLSVLLTATAVIAPAAAALARRQRGFTAILSALALAQVLLHLLFGLTGHGSAGSGSHHGNRAHTVLSAHQGMPMGTMADLTSPRMLAFHLIAAAVTALVLTRGEAAAFRLASLWRRLVRRTLVLLLPTPAGPQRLPRSAILVTPAARRLTVRHARRGPPVRLLV